MKHIRKIGIAVFSAALLVGGASQAQVKIALDSPQDMENSGSYVWAHTFAEYLNSHGMKAEEFQRGALGGDDELFDQVSQGVLEVSMSPLNIVGSIDKLIYGMRLPYFFKDMAEVDRALNEGGMMAKINEATTKDGVRVVSVNTVGQASGIFNTKKTVKSVADMAGLRMRALDESQIDLYKAWGATGTIVSWAEVPNALQTGVADGYLNPPFVPLLFGHTDFIKYFTDARISEALRITIISEDWYQGLSDEDRATVDAAIAEATAANRKWLEGRTAILDKLREAGVEVVTLDQAARDEFRAASGPAYDSGLLTPEQIAEWEAAKGN